jgi:hypothetical protein
LNYPVQKGSRAMTVAAIAKSAMFVANDGANPRDFSGVVGPNWS